ncbi:putative LPS assembly protein LptD [Pedobacter sp.]|uniref:putative LPS assembly protein LptD n=1 Tax=Pedobacter sp. TaxID=1411316 RepID=UPI003D7FFFFD
MKHLRQIILFKSILLLILLSNNAIAFEGLSAFQVVQQTDTIKKDSVSKQDTTLTKVYPPGFKLTDTIKNDNNQDMGVIEYSAQDSTKYSKDRSVIYLYGKARVIYQGFQLDADYITYDNKTHTIFARGSTDAKGRYTGKPIFTMEGEGTSIADSLYYNTETTKGTVYNTFMEQEGSFFSGGQSKKQPDNEIHVKNMLYSTCNLPHPHFGFMITKGVVTDKQVITGPVYLTIEDIPLPLALPFAFFPKPNKKSSGVIVPSFGEDAANGFFLNDGGYYLGLSDYWDARIMGSIFTNGSYRGTVSSNYLKRYKFNGHIDLNYSSTKSGIEGTIQNVPAKDFQINWTHSQNPNASPGSTFSASVMAGTGSYNVSNPLNSNMDPYAISRNVMSSSIAYSKTAGIFNISASANSRQETLNETISLTLPQVSVSMTSINPFDSKKRVGDQKWYQKFNLGYSMDATNTVNTTEDQLFAPGGLNRFQNGFNHNLNGSLPFTLAKYFNFSTNANYIEQWHFQTTKQTMLKMLNGQDSLVYDTIQGFKRSGEYNIGISMNTKIYNTLQFKKTGKLQALRHVMTPSIGISYRPDFSALGKGYYKELLYQDGTPVYDPLYQRNRIYSIFQNTQFPGPSIGQNASINFGVVNDVEIKVRSLKDTTGTGVRKLPIIQGLNINGGYNLLAPRRKLSNLSFGGRSNFTEKIGITFSGMLNPYQVADSIGANGQLVKYESNRYTWQRGQLPRLTNFGFSFDYSLNPASFQRRQENLDAIQNDAAKQGLTAEQANQLNAISRDPNAFVDFNIPWNLTLAYSFNYSTNEVGQSKNVNNNLTFRGDFNVTPKWKVTFDSGYDFGTNTVAMTRFSIYRDLHCWDMNFNWIPFGFSKSYGVTIRVKASILQDLKLSKQQSARFY